MAITYKIFRDDQPIEIEAWNAGDGYGWDYTAPVKVELTLDEKLDIERMLGEDDEGGYDEWRREA